MIQPVHVIVLPVYLPAFLRNEFQFMHLPSFVVILIYDYITIRNQFSFSSIICLVFIVFYLHLIVFFCLIMICFSLVCTKKKTISMLVDYTFLPNSKVCKITCRSIADHLLCCMEEIIPRKELVCLC